MVMRTLGRWGPNSSSENEWGSPSLFNIGTTILNNLDQRRSKCGPLSNSVGIILDLNYKLSQDKKGSAVKPFNKKRLSDYLWWQEIKKEMGRSHLTQQPIHESKRTKKYKQPKFLGLPEKNKIRGARHGTGVQGLRHNPPATTDRRPTVKLLLRDETSACF